MIAHVSGYVVAMLVFTGTVAAWPGDTGVAVLTSAGSFAVIAGVLTFRALKRGLNPAIGTQR